MSEYLFQQFAPEILKLHRQTAVSWLAVPQEDGDGVYSAPYAHIGGRYYFSAPQDSPELAAKQGIVLIEDEADGVRLSWVGHTREVPEDECVYFDACAELCKRCRLSGGCLQSRRVWEFCPEQGRLNTGKYDSALSPQVLQRALAE
ncbi:MAG: hypothetical protein Q4D82_05840 [Neisseria sp.]|nr:hypothetical protein [Neisseria sp.]